MTGRSGYPTLSGSVLLILPVLAGLVFVSHWLLLEWSFSRTHTQFYNQLQQSVLKNSISHYYPMVVSQLPLLPSCEDRVGRTTIYVFDRPFWLFRCLDNANRIQLMVIRQT
jgi:hypothetical protein